MKVIGCDFHPGHQQIAVLDLATGEIVEKALSHERKEEVQVRGEVCLDGADVVIECGPSLRSQVLQKKDTTPQEWDST